jgi:hypothetical protein
MKKGNQRMFNYFVFCFDGCHWFIAVSLELLPSGLIDDEL